MNARTGLGRLVIAVLSALCAATSGAQAYQAGSEEARAREEIGAQLEELGTTLRAAVMSGTLEADVARQIWGRVARAAKAAYMRDYGDGGDGKEGTEAAPSAKGNTVRLMAPKPEQVRVLLRGEFLKRDMQLLRDGLELDRDQMAIVEILFEDYTVAYDLAAAPLQEALVQYRRGTIDGYIAFALESAGVQLEAAVASARRADPDEALARMTEALRRIDREKAEGIAAASDEDRAKYAAWKESMIAATAELEERLAAIHDRTAARLTELGSADSAIGAADLVDMAKQLRADREQLRGDIVESLASITVGEQQGTLFEEVLARIRIGHVIRHGRLGGESMNLWAALAEISREHARRAGRGERLIAAEAMLQARAPSIAAALDERTNAAIDREIAGLEFQDERDRIAAANGEPIFEVDGKRLEQAIRPFAAAARREVDASVAARNALLTLLAESAAFVLETSPHSERAILHSVYRDRALRRGFPVEMRPRWAERATEAALLRDDLDDDALDPLITLMTDVAADLRRVRNRAIAARIDRDPALAFEFIATQYEGKEKAVDDDVWREVHFAAFEDVDDRAENGLRSMLTPEQFDELPVRKRAWGGEKDGSKSSGKGRGKGP